MPTAKHTKKIMKRFSLSLVLFLYAINLLFASEKNEPSLGYTLLINNEKLRIGPGEEKQLSGTFTDPKVKLIPDDFRLFTYGGVTFKYPANFTFEADLKTDGLKIWTLNGVDYMIIMQEYATEKTTPAELANELKKTFGADTKVSNITRVFNGKTLSGKRIFVTLAGTSLIQDVLAIPTEKGSRILLLQDTPAGEKTATKETKQTQQFLNETLKY